MQTDCIPFSALPHTSKLFNDFLDAKVRHFYPRSIRFGDWVADEATKIHLGHGGREAISEILKNQNASWNASPETLANIERLRKGSCSVVTGQQVGLFGGPLFSVLKALTAIRLAEEATQKGIECVPIFWLASEDHDFAEVNHANLLGKEKTLLRRIEVNAGGLDDAPVSARPLGKDVEAAVATAAELLGDSEITDLLRTVYRSGATLGSAMAKLFARLFGDYGLILLDPSTPEVHRIAVPIFTDAIRRADELDKQLLQRGKELESAGYHQQVKVTESSTLLFSLESGSRVPVRRAQGRFLVGKEQVTPAEMEKRISQSPEKFSANVLLRPVMQDFLLPTLCYVGGPAEVAYFAQAEVVYKALLDRVTPVVPRCSATLVEERQQKILQKFSLSLPDLFQGTDHLKRLLAERVLPGDLQKKFDAANEQLETSLTSIIGTLKHLDPTLADAAGRSASKMRYQLKRMRDHAIAAELRRSEVLNRKAEELSTILFPNNNLQEREIAGVTFLARHGIDLIHKLHATLQTSCPGHQIVNL